MIHALLTLAFCVPCLLLSLPWPVFFWPAAFYAGREHAQAEERYIDAHGGKRADCPWWCGFAPSAWTIKGLLDFLLPLAVSVGFALDSVFLR